MTPNGVWRKRCLLLWVPVLWALPSLRLTAWGRKTLFCLYGYLFVGSAQFTPNGVGAQNFVLLIWVPVRGLCPHPPETEFLDFQLGYLGNNA